MTRGSRRPKLLDRLVFGTAGVPESAESRNSLDGVVRVDQLGLGCMELEFVYGVRLSEEQAVLIGDEAKRRGVVLTAHAPYYINLTSTKASVVRASKKRILQSARIGRLCGARSITFHPGFYGTKSPKIVLNKMIEHLQDLSETLDSEGNGIRLRPEVTGRLSQFGSLEETLELCRRVDSLLPCLDFSHIYARELGAVNDKEAFDGVLTKVSGALGCKALHDLHLHVSGIEFGPRGERKHRNLSETEFDYKGLLKALAAKGAKGVVICESRNPEPDALMLSREYEKLARRIAAGNRLC
jgi:deoxyribonuclease-4